MDKQAATKARLGRVRAVSAALAKATDELNESFQRVESALQSCGCTIAATAAIPDEPHETNQRDNWVLCWSRGNSGWGLTIARDAGDYYEDVKPISQASRDFRIRAACVLDNLLADIERELESTRLAVTAASLEARQFADAIAPPQLSSGGGSDEDIPF